jgi:hypothetical protein
MPHDDKERPIRNARVSTIAMPVAQHDMVTVAYDDWDAPWQTSKTVVAISPGLPDDIEDL